MTKPKPVRSEAERHAQTRAAIPRVEGRIDDLLERRRQILREQDANALAAIRVDREIGNLRALRLRLIDQVTLLEPRVAQEQQQQQQRRVPTSLEGMKARLLEVERGIVAMDRVPKNDRSARHDADRDSLENERWRLTKSILAMSPPQPKESAA